MGRPGKEKVVCDRDCFHCPYDDCIADDMGYIDYAQDRHIDKALGLDGVKSTPSERRYKHQYDMEHKAENKERSDAWYQKNKERMREVGRRKYWENREEKLAYQREYRRKNAEKVRECKRKYEEKNREKIREKSRRYYQENREKLLAAARAKCREKREKRNAEKQDK